MVWEDIKIQVTTEVKKLLEERHILEDEVTYSNGVMAKQRYGHG